VTPWLAAGALFSSCFFPCSPGATGRAGRVGSLPAARAERGGGGQSKEGMDLGPCNHLLTFLGPDKRRQQRQTLISLAWNLEGYSGHPVEMKANYC
jgi:hypothetical protein